MNNLRRFTSPLASVNADMDVVILCEKAPIYAYADGKRTSDTPIGTRLTVALPGARMTQLSVKFDGTDPLPKINDEDLRMSLESCQFLYATLPGCEVTLYPSANGIGMTATGKSAQLVNLEK